MKTLDLNTTALRTEKGQKQQGTISAWFDKQADNFENMRFGMMAIYITIQSCLGSVAAMYVLQNDASVFFLAGAAALTMAGNAVFIAQGSAKLCLMLFYLNVIGHTTLILANL